MAHYKVPVLSPDRLSSVISPRVPDFSPSAVAMALAAGAAGLAAALAFSAVVCAVWPDLLLDEDGVVSSFLAQPQKITSKPSKASVPVCLDLDVRRIPETSLRKLFFQRSDHLNLRVLLFVNSVRSTQYSSLSTHHSVFITQYSSLLILRERNIV